MMLRREQVLWCLAVAAMLLLSAWNLAAFPSPWWDEGWTLSVARNWAVLGHYGLLLDGERVPSTLAAHLPVVAPIALSFKLFGVGATQARMVSVLFTIATLFLLYFITRRLFNRDIALATLLILLLFPAQWQMHPFIIGREVLGEIPALFYLLAGYACFLLTDKRPAVFMPIASLCWGVAVMTKLQVQPFWVLSMVLPIMLALLRRNWRTAGLIGSASVGSFAVYRLLVFTKASLIDDPSLPPFALSGLVEVSAFVLTQEVRLKALRFLFVFGLPTLLGIVYATRQMILSHQQRTPTTSEEVVRQMLIGLAGSWLAWHTLLSIGWGRYPITPIFNGAPLLEALDNRLTDKLNLKETFASALEAIRTKTWRGNRARALLAVLVFALMSVPAIRSLYLFSSIKSDASLTEAAHFLNTETRDDELIETYESELLFLLDRRYHFPPPRVNVEFIRQSWIDSNSPIVYDPLIGNPDYLVVGGWGKLTKIYDPVLEAGTFRLVRTIGAYDVYERKRN
jgi:4-amino-4-deoxy-L-arabinose transferase-like glycosyltransferase